MASVYDHHAVEPKWQKVWDDEKYFEDDEAIDDYVRPTSITITLTPKLSRP